MRRPSIYKPLLPLGTTGASKFRSSVRAVAGAVKFANLKIPGQKQVGNISIKSLSKISRKSFDGTDHSGS